MPAVRLLPSSFGRLSLTAIKYASKLKDCFRCCF
jgi:hypothetical protein